MRNLNKIAYGFTLIEIIIALVVVSIALGAVISTVGQTIHQGAHIKDKTLALWVAQNYVTEVSITRQWLNTGNHQQKVKMAGIEWYINNKVTQTPDDNMRRMDVEIFRDKNSEDKIITLVAYINQYQTLTTNKDQQSEQKSKG
jgi:general secretion pathway protein I